MVATNTPYKLHQMAAQPSSMCTLSFLLAAHQSDVVAPANLYPCGSCGVSSTVKSAQHSFTWEFSTPAQPTLEACNIYQKVSLATVLAVPMPVPYWHCDGDRAAPVSCQSRP